MINSLIARLSFKRMYLHFVKIMGYIPFDIENKKIKQSTYKSFSNSMKYFLSKEKYYKKTSNEPIINIMKNLMSAKLSIISCDLELAKIYIKKVKTIFNEINNIDFEGKITLIITQDLCELEIENLLWFNKIEKIQLPINNEIYKNDKEIKEIIALYEKQEVNSETHLMLTKKHLELVLENIQLNNKLDITEYKGDYDHGKNLLFQLGMLKNKIIKNKFVILDENNQLDTRKMNLYNNMLFSRLCSEIIKLKYYLKENNRDIFNDIYEIVKIQITYHNADPISFLCKNTNIKQLYDLSNYKSHISFERYINTFIIEIEHVSEKDKNFKIKQMENFIANDINERLIINKKY